MEVTVVAKVKVLIVDDSIVLRDVLQSILQGYDDIEVVGDATDGLAAIAKVEQLQPDLILMDVRMPVMDGLDATRLIKDKWPDVRVVVFTLYADQADALAAGADRFLAKGCSVQELVGTIRNYKP